MDLSRTRKPCPPEPEEPPRLPEKNRKHGSFPLFTVHPSTTANRSSNTFPKEKPVNLFLQLNPLTNSDPDRPLYEKLTIECQDSEQRTGTRDGARPTNRVFPVKRRDKIEVIVVPSKASTSSPPLRSQSWNGKLRCPVTCRTKDKSESVGSLDTTKSQTPGPWANPNGSSDLHAPNASTYRESRGKIDNVFPYDDDYTNCPESIKTPESPSSTTARFQAPPGKPDITCATPALRSPQTRTPETWNATLRNFTVEELHKNLLRVGLKSEKVDPFREGMVDGELFSKMSDDMLREVRPDLTQFELLRLAMFRDEGKFPKTSGGSTP